MVKIESSLEFFGLRFFFTEIRFNGLRTYRLLGGTVVRESAWKSVVFAQDARDRQTVFQQENHVIRSETQRGHVKFKRQK